MPDLVEAFSALAVSTDALLGDALSPYALFSVQGRQIGTIAIDVPIREVHDDGYTITQHPVESGTPISDHYFRLPRFCEMTCGFSDSTAGYTGYVQQVADAFDALAATRTPFDVSTSKVQYTSMMIANKQVITDQQSEFALFITVRLQEVIFSQISAGDAGPQGKASDQANPAETGTTTDMGMQSTTPLGQGGIGSDTAASARANTIAGYSTPVTTPQPTTFGGGVGGLPVSQPSRGIGSA